MFIRGICHRLLDALSLRPKASEGIFRLMIEHSGDVICYLVDSRFTYVSPSAERLFGWSPAAMVGTYGLDLIYESDLPILMDVFANRDAGGETGPISHQLRVICGDGSLKWSETTSHTVRGEGGRLNTILVIRDVSDRKRLEEELAALALKDGLTGLANRRSFDEMLERSWRKTLRQGSEMALLLLDIDHFKRFNDAYGHQAGDDCLRIVAATISRFARRPDDLACRYGGEEFAVIMGGAGPDVALDMAENIRAAVAALGLPHSEAAPGHLTISIGVATAVARIGGSVRMPESLLQSADHALYKAKAGGRNRVEQTVLMTPSEQG